MKGAISGMARGTVETQVGAGARTDFQDISRNATQQLLSQVRQPAAFEGGGAPVVTRSELTAPARLRRMWSLGTVCWIVRRSARSAVG
jgi:hypothetical protein